MNPTPNPLIHVLIGVPSNGTLHETAAVASYQATRRYPWTRVSSANGSLPNFNTLIARALTEAAAGRATHLVMLHSDIKIEEPDPAESLWADRLLDALKTTGAAFVSVPTAIKDFRGVTSSGIGDPADRWHPWRRFTVRELADLPETFTAEQLGYGDKYLLHNHACCAWDLRWPGWFEPNEAGEHRFHFEFAERVVRRPDGTWAAEQESDDWLFSRKLWQGGCPTAITTAVRTVHHGYAAFPSHGPWGEYAHDEDTAYKWRGRDPVLPAKETAHGQA